VMVLPDVTEEATKASPAVLSPPSPQLHDWSNKSNERMRMAIEERNESSGEQSQQSN
jgi:hypothetical protein